MFGHNASNYDNYVIMNNYADNILNFTDYSKK